MCIGEAGWRGQGGARAGAPCRRCPPPPKKEREFLIDNLLVRIHLIIDMISSHSPPPLPHSDAPRRVGPEELSPSAGQSLDSADLIAFNGYHSHVRCEKEAM